MTNVSKNSFILYKNYYEILNDLQDAEMGILFRAILKYQATGEILDMPAHLEIAFRFIKNQFDLDDKKYDEFIEKQSSNGKKGGRPKVKKEPKENPKNPTVFLETQKSLNENENVNENENENLSLLSEREESLLRERRERRDISSTTKTSERVSEADMNILTNYVRRKKLATKNISAYVRKIVSNGDHIGILKDEKSRKGKRECDISPEERIKAEIASISDKKTAFKVLARYHNALEEFPPAIEEIAKKYDLGNSYELEKYANEVYLERMNSP